MKPRVRVAKEAARLIYEGFAKEYIDAKEMAVSGLGINQMPSNFQVAVELDILANEREGEERLERLLQMRLVALKIMHLLKNYDPRLIGSVWRGTAYHGSDIDIVVHSSNYFCVKETLSEPFEINNVYFETFYIEGLPKQTTHIKFIVEGFEVEVVVKSPEDKGEERCEIYGDFKKGLDVDELEKLIKSNPFRRFVPRRRYK